jgi:demethylmenaquinone methyltransferase/2-methoxy-6-polyprenyl-1,4-benzoquinol methylase
MSQPSDTRPTPSRKDNWKMFDRIAGRYDLLNHLLSANIDKGWRRRVALMLPERTDLRVLDLACGTADQLLALFATGRVMSGIGLDLAENMLAIGREKIEAAGLTDRLALKAGDAEDIPFENEQFDAVTISFGIRNMVDVVQALTEMNRVLRPQGRVLILEFSLPPSRVFKAVYLFYLRHILPRLGRIISRDPGAYRYLNETIETFPCGDDFLRLMKLGGFSRVEAHPLTLGIATVYAGEK